MLRKCCRDTSRFINLVCHRRHEAFARQIAETNSFKDDKIASSRHRYITHERYLSILLLVDIMLRYLMPILQLHKSCKNQSHSRIFASTSVIGQLLQL